MLSSPNTRKERTEALKVQINCKSSFPFKTSLNNSIGNSISGSPSNDSSYNNNIPPSYPNTPIISNNLSYTNTPIDKLNNTTHDLISPITPITPDFRNTQKVKFMNNLSNSPSSLNTTSNINNDNNTQFPDTIAVENINKLKLDEIDEKKQLTQTVTKPTKPASNPNPNPNPKGKKPAKFSSKEQNQPVSSEDKLQEETLGTHGYAKVKYIADTLQGCTFMAKRLDNTGEIVVIKSTKKYLYSRGITISKEGKAFNISEDIVAEGKMMKYFMLNNPPNSLITFYDFFEDAQRYYLVMENGGQDFFDFVVKCHELINKGKLTMKEWRKQCKFMFAQIIQCIKWLHNKMNYCHLDISLENILISNDAYFDEKTGKLNKCHIKFIDFGLAEYFNTATNPFYLCKKYVGKTHYKSPKVYGKKDEFQANKADIWSLGVCLFMMIIGAPPYNKPTTKDPGFRFIREKKITKLLYSWNRIKYVTPNLYDLMEKMLTCDEEKRISMAGIVRHDWLKIYFPNDQYPITSISQTPLSPLSPSLSSKISSSFSQTNNNTKSLNIMIPQQAVSMSHSYSNLYNTSQVRKASSSYQYYSKYRPNLNNNNSGTLSTRKNSSTLSISHTPTPIVESYTINDDHNNYCAAVDINDKENKKPKNNKNSKKKNKKKKKKNKKFFKLSLSIFFFEN
eukprot:845627_1